MNSLNVSAKTERLGIGIPGVSILEFRKRQGEVPRPAHAE